MSSLTGNDGTGLREHIEASAVVAVLEGLRRRLLAELGPQTVSDETQALQRAIAALSAVAPPPVLEGMDWRSVSDELPPSPGWYIGCNYGVVEPLRFDGNNWHHTRITRDLAMPSHWCGFDSLARPGAPNSLPSECADFVQMVGDEFGNAAGIRLRNLFASLAASPAAPAQPEGGEADGPHAFDCGHAAAVRACGCGFCVALTRPAPTQPDGGDAWHAPYLRLCDLVQDAGQVAAAIADEMAEQLRLLRIALARPAPAQQAVTDRNTKMSNDGTGLRERNTDDLLDHLWAAFYDNKDGRFGDPKDTWRELKRRAALSAVAPPPVLEGPILLVSNDDSRLSRLTWCRDEGEMRRAVRREVWGPGEKLTADEEVEADEICTELLDCGAWYPEGDPPLFLFRVAATPATPAQPEGGEAVELLAAAKGVMDTGNRSKYPEWQRLRAAIANFEARPAPAQQTVTDGAGLIAAERARQVGAEGWTNHHDDEYEDDQLALAAVSYALPERFRMRDGMPRFWPWSIMWWKPKDRIRDLTRAGALIAAEIDRLQRAALASNAAASAADAQEQPR